MPITSSCTTTTTNTPTLCPHYSPHHPRLRPRRPHSKPAHKYNPLRQDNHSPHRPRLFTPERAIQQPVHPLPIHEPELRHILPRHQPRHHPVEGPVHRPGRRRRVRVLLARVELVRDEGFGGFAEDPLVDEAGGLGGVAPDFGAGREGVDVLGQVVVEERGAGLEGVRHFGAVAEAGQEVVGEVALWVLVSAWVFEERCAVVGLAGRGAQESSAGL